MSALTRDMPRTALTAAYWLFALYLFLPLLLMSAMSFKDANFVAFPIETWTLDWYAKVVQDKVFLSSIAYSLFIAVCTTISGTIVGTWIALLIAAEGVRFRPLIFGLACLPAVVPGMINAISMRIFIELIDMPTGTAGDHPRPHHPRRALRRGDGADAAALDAAEPRRRGARPRRRQRRRVLPGDAALSRPGAGRRHDLLRAPLDRRLRPHLLPRRLPHHPADADLRQGHGRHVPAGERHGDAGPPHHRGRGLYAERLTRRSRSR